MLETCFFQFRGRLKTKRCISDILIHIYILLHINSDTRNPWERHPGNKNIKIFVSLRRDRFE